MSLRPRSEDEGVSRCFPEVQQVLGLHSSEPRIQALAGLSQPRSARGTGVGVRGPYRGVLPPGEGAGPPQRSLTALLSSLQLAKTQGNVFATDAILATLMSCTRSVYSWDIVVQRVGSKLFFDKRDNSDFGKRPVCVPHRH